MQGSNTVETIFETLLQYKQTLQGDKVDIAPSICRVAEQCGKATKAESLLHSYLRSSSMVQQ
jgi:hypothetical protein